MSASATVQLDRFALSLVRHKARQLVGYAEITESDVPDIEQELLADLIAHMPKHDSSRGTTTTFAARIVKNRISKILRHRRSEMRDVYRESCSLDDLVEDSDDENTVARHETLTHDERRFIQSIGSDPVERHSLRLDIDIAMATLPEELRIVCELLRTETPAATARRMGIARTTLYGLIKKLRGRLRAYDLDGYL